MGAGEDIVNNEASTAENPANHATSTTENPISSKGDLWENSGNDQAIDVENHINDQPNRAVNPLSNQVVGSENIANNLANVAEAPVNNQMCGAEDLVGDQPIIAENVLGGAKNSLNDPAGNAEHSDDFVNDEAHLSENSTNNIESGNETASQTSTYKIPVNSKADAVKNPLDDKQDAAENFVEEKSDANEIPSDSEETVETPVSNKADCLPAEAKEILISLAGKWEDVLDASALQVIPLKGAMTNEVFQIKWPVTTGETSRKVLVRIYGEGVEIFFDRGDEIRTFEYMSKNGQGPRLLGRFTNGRVEEFIHARTLSAPDLRNPSISALIAAKMKEFHDLDMPGQKKVNLWNTLRSWLIEAKRLSSPKEVEAFYLDTVDKEISVLEKELSGAYQKIGFCHNDLQYGNIMLDEDTKSVTIIDYEYASYNPVAYDIANHFCEMAANYHTETPHVLDYRKYPDFEERERFIRAYLRSSGEQPSESEVENLLQAVEKYTLANHLFWGIWGIISGQVNTIEFDYKEYAKQRFQEYWARKPYLLSSDAPSPYNFPEGTGELASLANTRGTSTKNNAGIFRKMKRVLGLGLFRSKN